MVLITAEGVTMEVEEGKDVVEAVTQWCNSVAQGFVAPGSIISQEDYLKKLLDHYRAALPKSSVLVTGQEHTILGPYKHFRYEQKVSIFGNTRRTDVYIVGRGLGTVFTLLGEGGFKNWIFDGDYERNNNTIRFQ
jgi:hypothetical protein